MNMGCMLTTHKLGNVSEKLKKPYLKKKGP